MKYHYVAKIFTTGGARSVGFRRFAPAMMEYHGVVGSETRKLRVAAYSTRRGWVVAYEMPLGWAHMVRFRVVSAT